MEMVKSVKNGGGHAVSFHALVTVLDLMREGYVYPPH